MCGGVHYGEVEGLGSVERAVIYVRIQRIKKLVYKRCTLHINQITTRWILLSGMADRRQSGAVVWRGRSHLSTSRHQRGHIQQHSSGEEEEVTKQPKVEEDQEEDDQEEEGEGVESTRHRSGAVRSQRSASREKRKDPNSEVSLEDKGTESRRAERYTTVAILYRK